MTDKARIPLMVVKQWLKTWEIAGWKPDDEERPEPPREFYMATMPIRTLRRLAGVSTRDLELRKAQYPQPGYQRGHEKKRSDEISRYISYGYPLSTQKGLQPEEHRDLINPGWLPTAILINVIPMGEKRYRGSKVVALSSTNAVEIKGSKGQFFLEYPALANEDAVWEPKRGQLEPLEIIDGQHRLYAIDPDEEIDGNYEVPVIFFNGLAQSWQAYLFWVINVEPKKINTSLAFDLYPELRSQRWLERGEWIKVYQEHRAQELTEAIWRHPQSPWRDRIEMLGKRIEGHVSNAAFIRTLMASFVRRWGTSLDSVQDGDLSKIGGLFGSIDKEGKGYVIPWKRPQQVAFLISLWQAVLTAVEKSKSKWVVACKDAAAKNVKDQGTLQNPHKLHPAFAGPHTLLGTDQGVRAVCVAFNAVCQAQHQELQLADWISEAVSEPDNDSISLALKELHTLPKITKFLDEIAKSLVDGGLDWRTSSEPSLGELEQKVQGAYRGSSGYGLLPKDAMRSLLKSSPKVANAAKNAAALLNWELTNATQK